MSSNKNVIIKQLNQLIDFLEPLKPLLNSHLSSFFTEDLWESCVPLEIKEELNDNDAVESFIKFYPEIITSNCSSKLTNSHPVLVNFINQALKISVIKGEDDNSKVFECLKRLVKSNVSSDSEIDGFMTSKKLHEVKITSKIAAQLHDLTKSSHFVDIGGGKGYLCCTLTYHYGFKVLGLDFSSEATCGAIKRSDKLAKFRSKEFLKLLKDENNKQSRQSFLKDHYKQIITFVKPDTNVESFLKESFNEQIIGITLTGLHTCGDLSATCLRMFLNNELIKGIINIGCCYNKISEEFENEEGMENFGFPMSSYLRGEKYKLGKNVRMAGCFSVDRIAQNNVFESSQSLLFYRALFEIVRRKLNQSTGVQKLGQFARKSKNFGEYLTTVLKKLNCDIQLTEEEVIQLYENYLDKKPFLTAFYLLKVSLAPVVESIILLDRILYLVENNIPNVYLVPLFDLKVSPRGLGIIAWKDLHEI